MRMMRCLVNDLCVWHYDWDDGECDKVYVAVHIRPNVRVEESDEFTRGDRCLGSM